MGNGQCSGRAFMYKRLIETDRSSDANYDHVSQPEAVKPNVCLTIQMGTELATDKIFVSITHWMHNHRKQVG